MDKDANSLTIMKPTFSWEINLGHVLQISSILFAVVVGWFMLEKRLSMVEAKNSIYEREAEKLVQSVQVQREALTMLVRQVDRLAILSEANKDNGKNK